MLNSNVHIVNNVNSSQTANGSPKLHAGSIVNGRVVSHNGGNSWTVSVAGQKVNVTSQVPLKTGELFTARLGVSGNSVTLKLLGTQQKGVVLTSVNSSNFNPQNPVLVNMLNGLGLPVTSESLKLIQFALNMGIKIEGGKLVKAYVRGKEDENSGEEKAQIALLMEEKGMNATSAAVHSVYQKMHQERDDRNENQAEDTFDQSKQEVPVSKDDVKDFFKQVDIASCSNKAGALTLFNSVTGSTAGSGHWLVFPFEWEHKNSNGVIRVLFDENIKSLRKVAVECHGFEKNYCFVLYFNNSKIDAVKACFTGSCKPELKVLAEQTIQSLFGNDVKIQIADEDELKGFITEDTGIPVFRGEA